MRGGAWGTTEVWFSSCAFPNTPHSSPQEPHSTREKQETEKGLRYQLLYYFSGTSPGAQPQGGTALLFLVAVFMGRDAHLHHEYQELLKVDCVILVDIQLLEPGVCILFLSRGRKEAECKDLRECGGMAIHHGDQGPPGSSEPGGEPGHTQPLLTFMYWGHSVCNNFFRSSL